MLKNHRDCMMVEDGTSLDHLFGVNLSKIFVTCVYLKVSAGATADHGEKDSHQINMFVECFTNLTEENTTVNLRTGPSTSLQLIEMDDALGTDVLNVYTGCCYVTQVLFQKEDLVNRILQVCHHPQPGKMREQQNVVNGRFFFHISKCSFISDLQFYLFDMSYLYLFI